MEAFFVTFSVESVEFHFLNLADLASVLRGLKTLHDNHAQLTKTGLVAFFMQDIVDMWSAKLIPNHHLRHSVLDFFFEILLHSSRSINFYK